MQSLGAMWLVTGPSSRSSNHNTEDHSASAKAGTKQNDIRSEGKRSPSLSGFGFVVGPGRQWPK
jgi:hypothetical protein